jgi:septal ring factor EnvC (AmiA/AmiB activator)
MFNFFNFVKKYLPWIITTVVLLAIVYFVYSYMSYSIAKVREDWSKDIINTTSEIQKEIEKAKIKMESDYENKLREIKASLEQLRRERNAILTKLKDIEAKLSMADKERETIESKTYTRTELDDKFSAILKRGKK